MTEGQRESREHYWEMSSKLSKKLDKKLSSTTKK